MSSAGAFELPPDSVAVTCTAPVNIAVIKYWGKRDERLILPVNSSLSGTLHQDSMRSQTTVIASKSFEKDHMLLNNEVENVESKRVQAVINTLRKSAEDFVVDGRVVIRKQDWADYKLRIISNNDFPTAAGLASSASGFACLTTTIGALYGVKGNLSAVARQGSGSACRSMFGGFVKWEKGDRADGLDSVAVPVAPAEHWDDMRVLICVVNEGRKTTSSTAGMELTVKTSPLIQHRMDAVVPKHMQAMEAAIAARDFNTFAELTMRDSNSFHAVCLDTYPPISYLNDTSRRIIRLIHVLNELAGEAVAAYTFDAGPNAVIYLPSKNVSLVLQLLVHYFSKGVNANNFVSDRMHLLPANNQLAPNSTEAQLFGRALDKMGKAYEHDAVRSVIVTKLGPGPVIGQRKHTFTPRSKL